MSDLFDRAREAMAIEDVADKLTKLSGSKDEKRGYCPLCRAGETSGSKPFKVSIARQSFTCFMCEAHGDVVDLYAAAYAMTGYEAAQLIAGAPAAAMAKPAKTRAAVAESDNDRAAKALKRAVDMWRQSVEFHGSAAEAYLLGRGIAPEIVAAIDGLRFHPAAPHHWSDDERRWIMSPAMIAKVETAGGWPGGVHATYIAADGSAKADLDPAKQMWGPQTEQTPFCVRPGGAWLIGKDASAGDLATGEGIETTLSLASFLHRHGKTDIRAAASLSLNRLQGGVRRDEDGCVDIWRPMGDPAKPPFLARPCNTDEFAPAQAAFLAIDRDMSRVRMKGRNGRGRETWFELDAEARARLCARLAAMAWRGAGWPIVKPMWPAIGGDWNDIAKEAAK